MKNNYVIYFFCISLFILLMSIILYIYNLKYNNFKEHFTLSTVTSGREISCTYQQINTESSLCSNNEANQICSNVCPPDSFPVNQHGEHTVCASYCTISCPTSNLHTNYTTRNGEIYGFKQEFLMSNLTFTGMTSTDANCIPDYCPELDFSNCPSEWISHTTDGYKLCCKYPTPDNAKGDIQCYPSENFCPEYWSHDNYDPTLKTRTGGVKLLYGKNGDTPLAIDTVTSGRTYAFKRKAAEQKELYANCSNNDVLYEKQAEKGNCIDIGINHKFCCSNENSNIRPTLFNNIYPTCDIGVVNLLNSVDLDPKTYVSSNIITQMYNGYNFHTNIYHQVNFSNIKQYEFQNNDVIFYCISNDGSVKDECKKQGDLTYYEHPSNVFLGMEAADNEAALSDDELSVLNNSVILGIDGIDT